MVSKVSVLTEVLFIYAVVAAALSAILGVIWWYFRRTQDRLGQRLSFGLIVILIGPLLILALAWVDARYIEPQWIQVTKLTVKDPTFPEGLKDIKIVQISDLHIREFGRTEKNLIKILNRLEPDYLLITGDFVDSISGIKPCFEVLRHFKARRGIYAVLGNHEDYFISGQRRQFIEDLKKLGIVVLEHGSVRLEPENGSGLWLVGLSENFATQARYGREEMINEAFRGVPSDEAKILMIHNPNVMDVAALRALRPQLVLAGHTHGGQFGLPFIRKYSGYAERSKYMSGYFDVDGIPLYVNRGIGTQARPIRFLCRPEVAVIALERAAEK